MLTGACLSRACGFPERARYATAACVIAAELPDADYVYRLGGPLSYFEHHRGWTHALWSLPLQALLVTAIFFAVHRTRHLWKKHRSVDAPAPARWGLLWLIALGALCSHVALDWTNNYGVRPLAPFNPHWFAGNLFFIVEPVLLAALGLALLLPLVYSLFNREPGIRRARYRARGLAIGAVVVLLAMLLVRSVTHTDADDLAHAQLLQQGAVLRASASPYPVSINRWHGVIETHAGMQAGVLSLKTNTMDTDPQTMFRFRPDTPAVAAAKGSWLGRVYLDWSTFPEVVDLGTAAQVHPDLMLSAADGTSHVVRFSDLRFQYDTIFMHGSEKPPLSAEAWVDSGMKVRRIYFGDDRQALPK